MSCLGVHFAICSDVAEKLLEAADDDELIRIVQEEIEERWDKDHLFETDKAWDALHRSLSDGTLDFARCEGPMSMCFFGGEVLNESPDYFVVLLTPKEVSEIAGALRGITRDRLRERYFSLEFPDYQGEKSEEDFEYSWGRFEGLPEFFLEASTDGRYVIFTVDQ